MHFSISCWMLKYFLTMIIHSAHSYFFFILVQQGCGPCASDPLGHLPCLFRLLPSCTEPTASRCHRRMYLNIMGDRQRGQKGACPNLWLILFRKTLFSPKPSKFVIINRYLFYATRSSVIFKINMAARFLPFCLCSWRILRIVPRKVNQNLSWGDTSALWLVGCRGWDELMTSAAASWGER